MMEAMDTYRIEPAELIEELQRRFPLQVEVCAQAVLIRRLMDAEGPAVGEQPSGPVAARATESGS